MTDNPIKAHTADYYTAIANHDRIIQYASIHTQTHTHSVITETPYVHPPHTHTHTRTPTAQYTTPSSARTHDDGNDRTRGREVESV